jgi:peptidoglycan/LPS O-acetylase OafA/YrhL
VNGALWTLHFEVLSYIALALLSVIGLLHQRSLVLMCWIIVYALYIAFELDPSFAGVTAGRLVTFIDLFVYFGCGVLFYLYREFVPFSFGWACASLVLLLVALPLGDGPLIMPICLPYLVLFCGLSSLPGRCPLKHDLSYGVYLIHSPILLAFALAFPDMHVWWIGAAAVFPITLILAYVSWLFVEGPALAKKKAISNFAHSLLLG